MPKTKLQLINAVLNLVGETSLTTSAGSVGQLTTDIINTAIINIAQETRANIFEQVLATNVTAEDHLTPAITLPAETLQVYSVMLRISTGLAVGDKLIPLEYLPLENTPVEPSYSVVGSEVFVSPMIARPFTLRVHTIRSFALPVLDNADSGLPDVVLPTVQHAAAAILAMSYLDDANSASLHRNLADQLTEKLRKQYGNNRAKTFNIAGSRSNAAFSYGAVSSISGGVAYAPLDSPAITGNPTVNGNTLVITPTLTTALSPYLLTTTAASTYLTQSTAASTYLTQASAASTYLTPAVAASTYQTQTTAATVNRPAFSVYKEAAIQDIGSGVPQTITYNGESFDTDNAFASNQFTVPVGKGGFYEFAGNIYGSSQSGTGSIILDLRLNGVAQRRLFETNVTALAPVAASFAGVILNLAAGDNVSVSLRPVGTVLFRVGLGSANLPEQLVYFSGKRLNI